MQGTDFKADDFQYTTVLYHMVLVKTTVSCGVGQGSMLFNHRFLSFFNNEMVLFNMGETRPLFAYFRLFQHNDKPCTYFEKDGVPGTAGW